MNKYIPPKIRQLEEYIPNDTIYQVRLDANENPCPPSSAVIDRFSTLMDSCDFNRYPDPYAAELIAQFCRVYGCDTKNTVAGNGSDELISILIGMLCEKGDKILVTKPDFSMYAFYASLIGCRAVTYEKDNGTEIDFAQMRRCQKEQDCRLVIFSNPCNPTGLAYDRDTVLDFVKSVDCLVIVDEAYMEFCPDGYSVLDMCGKLENLIVLKTLSKAYASAALRVGFAIADADIAAALRKVKSPYNLGTLPQLFGRAVLENSFEVFENAKKIAAETQKLSFALTGLSEKYPYTVHKTHANFVLLTFPDSLCAKTIYEKLKKYGIIVRCLNKSQLRITCGTEEENTLFLQCFEKILTEA